MPRPQFTKAIGVLGGLGPLAGAHILRRLIERATECYGCVQDQDFPRVQYRTIVLPSGWDERGFDVSADPVPIIATLGAGVVAFGSPVVLILGCNTLHAFYRDLAASVPEVTLVDMIEATVLAAVHRGLRCVGVLSSETTQRVGLFDHAAVRSGLKIVSTVALTDAILAVMQGHPGAAAALVERAILDLRTRGAEAVILGCTELSTVRRRLSFGPGVVVDAVDCAVDEALKESTR